MIDTKVVHNLRELKKETINDIRRNCIADFGFKVMSKMFKGETDIPYNTLANYDLFDKLGRKITCNTKNFEYTETLTNVKDEFLAALNFISQGDIKDDTTITKLSQEVKIKINSDAVEKTYKVAEVLFGVGEFPYITIYIARIGNQKYYFYTLER